MGHRTRGAPRDQGPQDGRDAQPALVIGRHYITEHDSDLVIGRHYITELKRESALVIGRHYISERDSAPVQYKCIV